MTEQERPAHTPQGRTDEADDNDASPSPDEEPTRTPQGRTDDEGPEEGPGSD